MGEGIGEQHATLILGLRSDCQHRIGFQLRCKGNRGIGCSRVAGTDQPLIGRGPFRNEFPQRHWIEQGQFGRDTQHDTIAASLDRSGRVESDGIQRTRIVENDKNPAAAASAELHRLFLSPIASISGAS